MTAPATCTGCGTTSGEIASSSQGVLCHRCYLRRSKATASAARLSTQRKGSSLNDAVTPPAPSPPFLTEDRSGLRELLQLHKEGKATPEAIDLPPLWENPTQAESRLYDLLRIRFGLLLRDGRSEPLMLAVSEVVKEGIVLTDGGASKLIHRFEVEGLIWSPGEMMPQGKGRGTRLFLPGPRPGSPEPTGGWRIEPARSEAAANRAESVTRPRIPGDDDIVGQLVDAFDAVVVPDAGPKQ